MNLGEVRYAAHQQNSRFIQKVIPRYTGFQLPEQEIVSAVGVHNGKLPAATTTITGTPLTIQELFKRLWVDMDRNRLIIQDIATAHAEGREILVLSERLDHLALLTEAVAPYTDYLFMVKGGMGKKQVKTIIEHIQNVPSGSNRIILATGKYLGEGFDLPCLDTLFLVFPFSWKGTLIQYVGRLNRTAYGKTGGIVYDYVDDKVPVLRRMFDRRIKGYKALGFTIFH
jgi:superfamily II DNA or RNA helicase